MPAYLTRICVAILGSCVAWSQDAVLPSCRALQAVFATLKPVQQLQGQVACQCALPCVLDPHISSLPVSLAPLLIVAVQMLLCLCICR